VAEIVATDVPGVLEIRTPELARTEVNLLRRIYREASLRFRSERNTDRYIHQVRMSVHVNEHGAWRISDGSITAASSLTFVRLMHRDLIGIQMRPGRVTVQLTEQGVRHASLRWPDV